MQNSNIEWTDDQKVLARTRLNTAVQAGKLPRPNTLPCVDCGHVWTGIGNRHEYDHHLGYAPEHFFTVQPVCKRCHVIRDNAKAKQTTCIHGHTYTPENTGTKKNGTRFCLQCRRNRENKKRTAAWWSARRQRLSLSK
jgi:hypothetical protein